MEMNCLHAAWDVYMVLTTYIYDKNRIFYEKRDCDASKHIVKKQQKRHIYQEILLLRFHDFVLTPKEGKEK